MATVKKQEKQNHILGILALIFGGIGLIPFFSFIFGIVGIILGLIAFFVYKDKLGLIGAILGGIGLFLTILIYVFIFVFAFSQMDDMMMQSTEINNKVLTRLIPELAQDLENYKEENGQYPNSISELSREMPLHIKKILYYEKIGENYYLFGLGFDGKPFTEDDHIVQVLNSPGFKVPE